MFDSSPFQRSGLSKPAGRTHHSPQLAYRSPSTHHKQTFPLAYGLLRARCPFPLHRLRSKPGNRESSPRPAMRVLTPPYHCAIVACPLPSDGEAAASQILYRGSIPAARNATFVRRLGIQTLVCMRKKPFRDTDPFPQWAAKNGITVIWIKADKMGEEALGMDRDQVTDVLKVRRSAEASDSRC